MENHAAHLPIFDDSLVPLLDMLPDAMILVNTAGEILHASEYANDMFSAGEAGLEGTDVDTLIPIRFRDTHAAMRNGYARDPKTRAMGIGMELRGQRCDGREFHAEVSLSPMQRDGELLILAAVRDISDRVRSRRELQRMGRELELAQAIQADLLPRRSPTLDGFDIAGASHPAVETGGDYFNYIPLDENRLAVIVGDVTGHGFGAALLAAASHAYLRALITPECDLENIATKLNQLLLADTRGERFITLFMGVIDAKTRRMAYVSGGHSTGYVLDASGAIKTELASTGPLLGAIDDIDIKLAGTVELAAGDLICVCTDGILEAANKDGALFDYPNVLATLREHQTRPASEIVPALMTAAADWCHHKIEDDMTAVIAKVL